MSLHATYDGDQLNDLESWSLQASSSPLVHNFPFAIGALVRPSGDVTRTITLSSVRLPPSKTKTQIEALYLAFGELLANGAADLVVEGVTYEDAIPLSLSPQNVVSNEYMRYSLTFAISKDQEVFQPPLATGRVRMARFYSYGGENTSFPIFDNFEMVPLHRYAKMTSPRVIGEYGKAINSYGGTRILDLSCWAVGQTATNFQKYMADWCIDPIGRMGTLDLSGNVIENCVMTDFSSQAKIGASMRYSVKFQTSVC